jgi:hypothetical protein
MEVQLTPDQRAFARSAVAAGRLRREEDAVAEALALWEERERRRAEFHATLASLARGKSREVMPESMRQPTSDVKEREQERPLEVEQWFRELTALSQSQAATPLLPDGAIDWEAIYGKRDL